MKTKVDCIHCYLKQAVSCMNLANIKENKQFQILYTLMNEIKSLDRYRTTCDNASEIIFRTYELIGNNDPYKQVKKESNDLALSLYPRLKKIIETSEEKLFIALKLAVAGNVIDLGINRSFDIDAAIEQSLKKGFTVNHYDRFRASLEKTDTVLILGDNSGEIVFDKLLVEELSALGKIVIYAVKSGPVLNDATMEDAIYTGMDQVAQVVESGSRYLGTPLNKISEEFKNKVTSSTLILSKGQANYESLSEEIALRDNVFYLLKIKCETVATDADASFGELAFFKK